jgi:hypothetical protein
VAEPYPPRPPLRAPVKVLRVTIVADNEEDAEKSQAEAQGLHPDEKVHDIKGLLQRQARCFRNIKGIESLKYFISRNKTK